jgi:uncharacterized protein (DUF58 family)
MPKSSRKSWTQSRYQTSAEKNEAKPTYPTEGSSGEKQFGQVPKPPDGKATEKKPLELKLGNGMRLELPTRFFVCLIVAFALYWHAAFTANEWMYLLCSGFLAAILASLILPYLQLSEIEVKGAMPPEVVVSASTEILLKLRRNPQFGMLSGFLPVKSIQLGVALLKYSTIHETKEKVTPPEVTCLDSLSSELTLKYSTPALKRGLYELESVQLSSGFPFGLAWWRRNIEVNRDAKGSKLRLTVYPKSQTLTGYFLFKLQGLTARIGLLVSTSSILNKSTIIRGLREYRSGDSPRHIHWPSSAHQGKLLVREFDSEMLPAFSLYLDLGANWKTEDQFELAVLLTQSLTHLGHQLGTVPNLILSPPLNSKSLAGLVADLPQIPPGVELISEILARVEPVARARTESETIALKTMISQSFTDRPLLAISPASDSLVRSSARGDLYVYPVELLLIRGVSEEEQEPARPARKSRTALLEKEEEGAESSHWSLQTTHLATISEEADMETL